MVDFRRPEPKPSEGKSQSQDTPPKAVDVLAAIFHKWSSKGNPVHPHVPTGNWHAAQWFIDLMEPPHQWKDDPEPLRSLKTGEITGWRTPYHDRLAYLLHRYLRLPEPMQVWIVDCIKEGIPWRGEEPSVYSVFVEQHRIMKANKSNYIDDAQAAASAMGVKTE